MRSEIVCGFQTRDAACQNSSGNTDSRSSETKTTPPSRVNSPAAKSAMMVEAMEPEGGTNSMNLPHQQEDDDRHYRRDAGDGAGRRDRDQGEDHGATQFVEHFIQGVAHGGLREDGMRRRCHQSLLLTVGRVRMSVSVHAYIAC